MHSVVISVLLAAGTSGRVVHTLPMDSEDVLLKVHGGLKYKQIYVTQVPIYIDESLRSIESYTSHQVMHGISFQIVVILWYLFPYLEVHLQYCYPRRL